MYRCRTCQKRTEDIDNPPCNKELCEEFFPEKIATIHSLYFEGNTRKVLCTGRPVSPGIRGVGRDLGVTCIRCKRKAHENYLQKELEESNTNKEEPLEEV